MCAVLIHPATPNNKSNKLLNWSTFYFAHIHFNRILGIYFIINVVVKRFCGHLIFIELLPDLPKTKFILRSVKGNVADEYNCIIDESLFVIMVDIPLDIRCHSETL